MKSKTNNMSDHKIIQGQRLAALAILAFMIAAPVVRAQNSSSSQRPIQESPPVRFTVTPRMDSVIALKTVPNTLCVMHNESSNDSRQSLNVFADDEGTVRFHIRPSADAGEIGYFQLDCQANGKLNRFPLELRASSSPTEDMPAPIPEVRQPKPGAQVLPALSEDDAANLSREELVERGYPPRPDPETAPDGFHAWLKAVNRPATFVPPHLIANPRVKHAPQSINGGVAHSPNWSGFELDGPAQSFDFVQAEWFVPTIVNGEYNLWTYSALCIGLDGDGTSDLVQDGTEQDYLIDAWGIATNYYAWTELVPQQQTRQVVSNFTVNPGDDMLSFVSMCSYNGPNCDTAENGYYADFMLWDLTSGEYTQVLTPRGFTQVSGAEASWIMERPYIFGSLPDLAGYGVASMSGAEACNASFTVCSTYISPSSGITTKEIWMYNGNDLLSSVFATSSNVLYYVWNAFH